MRMRWLSLAAKWRVVFSTLVATNKIREVQIVKFYFRANGAMLFGQIEYFVTFEDSIEKYAYVTLYYTIRYGLSDDSDLKYENFVQVMSTGQTQ